MKQQPSAERKPAGRPAGHRLERKEGRRKRRPKGMPIPRLAVADPALVPVTLEALRALNPKHGATLYTRILAVLMRGLREMQGLSQGEAARLSGLPRQTIGQLEHGEHDPRFGTVRILCAGLRASFAALTVRAEWFSEADWQL